MKLLAFVFLFLNSGANEISDVNQLRKIFTDALTNESKARELIIYTDKMISIPLATGYKGAATMLLSKFSINPYSKLKYFNEGKTLLEKAILKDSSSVELRYLRFVFQTNIPSFLGYNSCIEKDKYILLESSKNISDVDLKEKIIKLLKNSKYVEEDEKKGLQ